MNQKKSTKRTLITSTLSLVLCMAMLIGTTFAWFTDSVISNGNIIASGKLDAELKYKNKYDDTEWIDASTGAIFNYDRWEPGYVDVKYVQVANTGNLAFKYRLNIVPETPVVDGEVDLADVIDVYVVAEPQGQITRQSLETMKKAGTLAELMEDADGAAYGVLLPAEDVAAKDIELAEEDKAIAVQGATTMCIALKMQETAGNEYQELSVGDGFRVELLATQYTWEKDSFDNQYDAGLEILEEGDLLVEENAIQYVYTEDGEKVLYLVTENYTSDTVNVPEGVTSLGNYSFYYNSNVKTVNVPASVKDLGRAFDSSKVETVNLSEGLESISNRAFRNTSALKNVTIPSTVTTIQESAFQNSGITESVVPASVTSIEKAAFGYCPNLKTITIEGNPVIENYAARACASLETVNLLGENVTFSGTSMVFSNAESGMAEKLTIYVVNSTVADAVEKANGSTSARKYKIVTKATTADSIAESLASGKDVAFADDITASLSGSAIYGTPVALIQQNGGTIDGNGHSLDIENPAYNGYAIETYGGTIKNLTINSTVGRGIVISLPKEDIYLENVVIDGPGYAINTTEHNGKNLVVTNSTVNGWTSLAGLDSVTFNVCKFGENTAKYWQNMGYDQDYDRLIRPYVSTVFKSCVFEKGFYLDLSALEADCVVTLDNCTVNDTVLTADNYTGNITIELPGGRTVADCVVFK